MLALCCNLPATGAVSTSKYPQNTPFIRLDSLTDNALMLRVKAGEVDRMGLLFERYHRPLFGFLYHMLGQPTPAKTWCKPCFTAC